MNYKLRALKRKLMKPGWTEVLHDELLKLPHQEAKKIVEAMTESEIHEKVNNRRFQEDYIARYIMYLRGVSEIAFWKHIKICFQSEEGVLWADDMPHFELMCTTEIPDDVFKAILDFAFARTKQCTSDQDITDQEAVGCVIKAQVAKFDRLSDINAYISLLSPRVKESAKKILSKMLTDDCPYSFF